MRSGLTIANTLKHQRSDDQNGKSETYIEGCPRNRELLDHKRLTLCVRCQAFLGYEVLTSIPPHPDPTDETTVSWMPSPRSGNLDKEDTVVCVPKR